MARKKYLLPDESPRPGVSMPAAIVICVLLAGLFWGLLKYKSSPRIPTTGLSRGKIAIIIDDAGYSGQACRDMAMIRQPLTVAILPGLRYSRHIAECARQYRKAVMLHLPLQPHDYTEQYPQGYIITENMPDRMVAQKFRNALASVPHVTGVNNHMGSQATENAHLMGILFNEMHQENLFYVDSLVTPASICRQTAAQYELPFAKRDIFLDNENNREYIEGQFLQLAGIAETQGFAVGIGHDRELTWQIVREQADTLSRQGYQIVFVNDLLNLP